MQPPAVFAAALVDAGAKLVLASKAQRDRAKEGAAADSRMRRLNLLVIDADEAPSLDTTTAATLPQPLRPDALSALLPAKQTATATAAVFFTSGSTGKPKLVPHSHAGLLWACRTKLATHGGQAAFRPRAPGSPAGGTLSFLPTFHGARRPPDDPPARITRGNHP